jgi:phosphoglycerate kinase
MVAEIRFGPRTVRDRVVLLRVDHNVPLNESGAIMDDHRIRQNVAGVAALARHSEKVILLAHLGYPRGRFVPALTTRPLAHRLASLLGEEVGYAASSHPEELRRAVSSLPHRIVYAENVRFLGGEELNEPDLAKSWANLADLYINDAFSVSHRPHASIVGLPQHMFSLAGPQLSNERRRIADAVQAPGPRAIICGGAKYVDKLSSSANIARHSDTVVLGGLCGIAAARVTGVLPLANTGELNCAAAYKSLATLAAAGIRVLIPDDWIVAKSTGSHGAVSGPEVTDIADIVDIGPRSIRRIEAALRACHSVIWAGPLGRYEIVPGRMATRRLLEGIARLIELGGRCAYGGGDTLAAKAICLPGKDCGVASTGGGAFLAFIVAGDALTGLAPLGGRVFALGDG